MRELGASYPTTPLAPPTKTFIWARRSTGQFEPTTTLARRFGAPVAARTRVLSYLRRAGATGARIDATGLFADATMKVSLAQHLFGTSLARYQSVRAGRYIAPTGATRIPPALAGAVTGVVGLNTRPVFAAAAVQRRQPPLGTVGAERNPRSGRMRRGTGAARVHAQPVPHGL